MEFQRVPRSRKDISSNGIWGWIGVGKRGAAKATLGLKLPGKLITDGWITGTIRGICDKNATNSIAAGHGLIVWDQPALPFPPRSGSLANEADVTEKRGRKRWSSVTRVTPQQAEPLEKKGSCVPYRVRTRDLGLSVHGRPG